MRTGIDRVRTPSLTDSTHAVVGETLGLKSGFTCTYNKHRLLSARLKMTCTEDTLGFLLADVSRLMRQRYQRELGPDDLTLAQARALVYVQRHPGLRQYELAELLEIQPITFARLLDSLVAQGLVERRADPQDRRAFRVHVLPAAEAQLARISALAEGVRAHAMQGLDASTQAALTLALKHLRSNLSAR